MKVRTLLAGALLGIALSGAVDAQAQVTFDMNRVTCADYNAMATDGQRDLAAWMSGWFKQKAGQTEVNFKIYAANFEKVHKWCAANPHARLLSTIEHLTSKPQKTAPGAGAIDVTKMSCQDFLGADLDAQYLLQAWMIGYLHSEKKATRIDVKSLLVNQERAHLACAKTPKDNFGATVRKAWN
ncbi:hypothetical protein BTR14_18295 [Rhizobium rhizosphaerae]|nr:HdeA/HdeB family chaperone [Xaviernesmea rhizosphaerae]OQP84806.1 hypothetical protein BTR14_18295 [Xaviernesmea rhizosphaerae]